MLMDENFTQATHKVLQLYFFALPKFIIIFNFQYLIFNLNFNFLENDLYNYRLHQVNFHNYYTFSSNLNHFLK